MTDLNQLFEDCLRAVENEPPVTAWEETGLIVTPAMLQAARERNARYRNRVKNET